MKWSRAWYLVALAGLASSSMLTMAATPSAADFLPIAAGGADNVEKPSDIKSDASQHRVEAASGQDAANAAVDLAKQDIASSSGKTAGACFMSFPSGCGVLASGHATYKIVPNAELSRLAQRRAFVRAFMFAKKEMAAFLGGLNNEARDEIDETLTRLNEANTDSATNRSALEVSILKQDVSKLLKGFVVYEVSDEQKDGVGNVFVSIATSPATCLKTGRQAAGFVSETTLAEGIDRLLLEIRQGVVAPVGGRIIEVPGTGEVAFVGFGAAVVGDSKDPEIRTELLVEAESSAKMYANDALCGIIRGDHAAWTGTIVEKHQKTFQEFAEAQSGDPLNAGSGDGPQRLEQAVNSMINTRVKSDSLASARSGRVPGGVTVKSWMDDDKHWCYAVAMYFPSATSKAADIGKMMDDANLVPDAGKGTVRPSTNGAGKVPDGVEREKPLPAIKPLPGGKVSGQNL